jgi:RHS repeat-associated protein
MTTGKQYDYLNRLTQISSQPGAAGVPALAFNYGYNAANQRTQDKLADGSYWVYNYDSLGQVISGHKHFFDNTPVPGQQFDYTFDTIGNRTQTLAGGDQNGANQRLASYYANNLNQLTSRQYPGTNDIIGAALATNSVTVNGQNAWRKGEYFWSPINLNNSGSAQWQTPTVVSANYNASGGLYAPSTPEQFTYDLDGNLKSDGRWNYNWDAENRLSGMTVNTAYGPAYQLAFAYDSQGRRIQKVVTNGLSVTTNRFLYDGWNVIVATNIQSAILETFMWGSDLSSDMQGAGGVGGLLEVSCQGTAMTNCFTAFDGNGNVSALVDASNGTVAANYEYGPFGEVIRKTGPMAKANPFRWSTEYQDDESDILMYPHRPYSASTGRWLSRDPIEESGGPNLYGFVGNSPINYVDPFGQMRWGDLERIRDAADAAVKNQTCCCGKSVVQATISGTASGQQVTDTINLNIQGGCVGILQYYWWDCFSAQQEYGNDNSPNKPPGQQAWQDYGWHLGSNPQTQSHKGTPGWVPFDWNDGNHWNWQAAVLYLHCASGHFRVDLQLSNALEWTWVNGGWGDSHDGSGGKL